MCHICSSDKDVSESFVNRIVPIKTKGRSNRVDTGFEGEIPFARRLSDGSESISNSGA